jgi:hypothetical protein
LLCLLLGGIGGGIADITHLRPRLSYKPQECQCNYEQHRRLHRIVLRSIIRESLTPTPWLEAKEWFGDWLTAIAAAGLMQSADLYPHVPIS